MKFKNYEEYFIFYLKEKRNYIKESSYGIMSNQIYAHLIPYFGKYTFGTVTNKMLNKYVLYLNSKGRIDNKGGLAVKTTKDITIVLITALDYAIKLGYHPPIDLSVRYPSDSYKNQVKTFTPNDMERLINYLHGNLTAINIGILIAIYTGIRIGELCALQYKDIDFRRKLINIDKTLQRVNIKSKDKSVSKIVINRPKSKNSIRQIPMNDSLYEVLLSLDVRHSNRYLVSASKKYIEPRSLRYHYKKILQELNIEYLPFHCLRHTFATRLINNTNDYKTVSIILGHSSIAITLDTYTHLNDKQIRSCINKY